MDPFTLWDFGQTHGWIKTVIVLQGTVIAILVFLLSKRLATYLQKRAENIERMNDAICEVTQNGIKRVISRRELRELLCEIIKKLNDFSPLVHKSIEHHDRESRGLDEIVKELDELHRKFMIFCEDGKVTRIKTDQKIEEINNAVQRLSTEYISVLRIFAETMGRSSA